MLRQRVSFAHNSYVFNEHLSTVGVVDRTKVKDTVILDTRKIRTRYRDLRDPYHLTTGGALGRVHKNFTVISLSGRIIVPDASQGQSMSDRERALLAAFDPALCLRDSPTTQGAYAFDFSEPTVDTGTYATGFIPLRYYVRPPDGPEIDEVLTDASVRKFTLDLIAADPRAYEQTEQTLVLSPGTPTGDVLNRGTVPAPLKATIVTSAAGSATFTITRSGVAFIIDLSAFGASTYIIVFDTCAPYGIGRSITRSGVSAFAQKASDPSTWLDAPVGTTSFAITNTTNVTSCTLAWYSARA